MGLDCYLNKKTGTHFDGKAEVTTSNLNGSETTTQSFDNVVAIIQEVGYWRKANQIHNYFVSHFQEKDDCRPSRYFDFEELAILRDICKQVLADHSKAEELLPSQSGFFFGGTDYDEWYFKDLENTIKIIDDIEAKYGTNSYGYFYESSW